MIGSYAYDMDLLMQLVILRAKVCVFFEEYALAIKDFKKLRKVADEMESVGLRMVRRGLNFLGSLREFGALLPAAAELRQCH